MRKYAGFILMLSLCLVLSAPALSFAQGEIKTEPARETGSEPEILWLWGEVLSVDAQGSMLTVKYFDYETEAEKDVALSVDEKTTYENAASLTDIKPKDTVSVDYVASGDKYIARNVSVEKPEGGLEEEGVMPKESLPEEAAGGGQPGNVSVKAQQQ